MAQQIIGWVFLTDQAVAIILLVAKPCKTGEQIEKECEVLDKVKTWPKFPWKTHLSLGWRASRVFSVTLFSQRLQPALGPGCCLLLVPRAGVAVMGWAMATPGALPQIVVAGSVRSQSPPALVELHPVYSSRTRREVFAAWEHSWAWSAEEVMRMMIRTKDNPCNQVKAILKRFVLNG